MGRLFDLNNPFWNFMGKLVDVAWLNILWFVCCIPIITIGPSTTALYYVMLKLVKDEEGKLTRSFFHSFKQNFKQGMIIGCIMIAVGIFFGYDIYYYFQQKTTVGFVIAICLIGLTSVYVCMSMYIYPILARFDNTVKNLFRHTFLVSIRHLPKTILMVIITVAVTALQLFVPFLIVLGYGLAAFLNSYLLVGILEQYMPKEELPPTPEQLAEMGGVDPSMVTAMEDK